MKIYTRVVRPWRRQASRPHPWTPRNAARLIRDTVSTFDPVPRKPTGWSTGTVDDQLSVLTPLLHARSSADGVHSLRSLDSLGYLLNCPLSNCRLAYLARDNHVCGYFMLNRIDGQCRIVDIYLHADQREHWRSAYTLAILTAIEDQNTCEVLAAAALPSIGVILQECGMRPRGGKPVFVSEPRQSRIGSLPLLLQFADSDAFCC